MATRRKTPIASPIRVRTWNVMTHAVEVGVAHGWRRAHKHDEHPSEEAIKEEIERAVMGEIAAWFEFDGGA